MWVSVLLTERTSHHVDLITLGLTREVLLDSGSPRRGGIVVRSLMTGVCSLVYEMPRKVRIPTPQGGYRLARFEPHWSAAGEVPLYTIEFAEADALVYGSGRAEVVMLGVPIILRMPVEVNGDCPSLVLRTASKRADVMALRKIVGAVGSSVGGGPGVADAKTWPTLVEYLTATVYPDGSVRVPSALVVVADSSGWRGCLSDKDNQRCLWKVADTLEGLLLALEEAAASDDPGAWRQSSEGKWKGKKRS